MIHRLKYLFFMIGIILLALTASIFLFTFQDRIDNQTLYAENQDLSISSILTNNYIEDDAERYTTFLYNQSQHVKYAVVELDSTLSEEEVLELLAAAFLNEKDDFVVITQEIASVSGTQYAVYNTEDHSDIMFLLTLITIDMYSNQVEMSDSGEQYRYDTAKILIDSQTGMLYFMGIYYAHNYYEDDDYGEYGDLFLNDPDAAASAFLNMISNQTSVFDTDLSCMNLIECCLTPFQDVIVGDVSYVEDRKDSTYVPMDGYADLTQDSGFLTGVELTGFQLATTFPIGFAARTDNEDTYVTVFCTVQFNKLDYSQKSTFGPYQCDFCIGLEEMAYLFGEFNYRKPSVG
ncbi:MAG: hypothetical protein LUG61_11540 [Lachnospiraceae bacterium]|nr:hypothetical protein [Lachnospiraceae bacterium]